MRFLLLACLFLAVTPATAGGPRQFGKAYERVEPSVVMVEASNGKSVRRGGGFVASASGLVVCASYTLERAKTYRIHVQGAWHPATLVAVDETLRVALLKVTLTEPLKPVAVAKRPQLVEGNWVVAAERGEDGKPSGRAGQVTSAPPPLPAGGPQVALVDAPGMAGSPLVNVQGEVVGMSLGRIDERRGRATPLEPLRAFLMRAASQP